MSMISEAIDLLEKARKMGVTVEVRELLIDAQSKIITEQRAHMETLEKCRRLEREAENRDAWERKMSRYKMRRVFNGNFVHELLGAHRDEEPAHWLCPGCAARGAVSVLQYDGKRRAWHCHPCGFVMAEYGSDAPEYAAVPCPSPV